MQKWQPKGYFHSARIPVPLLSTVRKDSRYGLAIRMKKLCHWVFIKHILKRICVTLRMRLSICMMRWIHNVTCLHRLTSKLLKEWNTNSSVLLKVAVLPIKHICIRKQKQFWIPVHWFRSWLKRWRLWEQLLVLLITLLSLSAVLLPRRICWLWNWLPLTFTIICRLQEMSMVVLSVILSWKNKCWKKLTRLDWAHNSVVNIWRMMSVLFVCLVTAPLAR